MEAKIHLSNSGLMVPVPTSMAGNFRINLLFQSELKKTYRNSVIKAKKLSK